MKKKNIITLIIIIVLSIISIVFTSNDYFLYKDSIMTIDNIKDELISTEYGYSGSKENYYNQIIEGTILNGKYKGTKVTATAESSDSHVYDIDYKKNDKVFVTILNEQDKDNITVNIENYKRDIYVVIMIVIFVVAIYLIGNFRGLLAILAVLIDIIIYVFAIELYVKKGINLIVLSSICTILFSIISLTLATGINKKTFATIISTLITTLITVLIAVIVLNTTGGSGIRFEQMEFLLTPYKPVFIAELILSGLGAIMDIAITLTSSINELVLKDKNITHKALWHSAREIGKDTMGTMLNVLLFTYLCGALPKFLLYYRNGISIASIISEYVSLEIVRSLVAGIGIVLCIPISTFIAIRILRGGESK